MTRHLLYFVHPVAGNGTWEWNCEQLRNRIDLFDGRRVVAVTTATGPITPPQGRGSNYAESRGTYTLDPPKAVMSKLNGLGIEWLLLSNDVGVGETAAFDLLRSRLPARPGEDEYTFYAHAKGVTYDGPAADPVRLWTTLLYSANLDFWPLIQAEFDRGMSAVGSFRWHGAKPEDRFIYAGTFFWWNNVRAARRPRYRRPCKRAWAGVELWPGRVFHIRQSACLFKDGDYGHDPYRADWMAETWREFVQWRETNAPHRSTPQ